MPKASQTGSLRQTIINPRFASRRFMEIMPASPREGAQRPRSCQKEGRFRKAFVRRGWSGRIGSRIEQKLDDGRMSMFGGEAESNSSAEALFPTEQEVN